MPIYLHPDHGLNPTISKCIICNEDTGEITLLGNAYKEAAPMHMVTSYIPCDKCKKKYLQKGVMLLDTDYNKKPTGSFIIITNEAFERIFNNELPKHKIAMCEAGIVQRMQKDQDQNV
jgi:hypothetical protein